MSRSDYTFLSNNSKKGISGYPNLDKPEITKNKVQKTNKSLQRSPVDKIE
jgi:hypothetical protein